MNAAADDYHLEKEYKFDDFLQALAFTNRVGELAEEQGHHPDVCLAWGKVKLGPVVAEGGRFIMPIPFTEMIWDQDLRPQGGAVALDFSSQSSSNRFALHGIYATGSHVFEDESVMFGGGLELQLASGQDSSLQLVGSYLQFEDLNQLEVPIRRQNTRVAGLIVNDYRVVDIIGRLSRGGQLPMQLVANYCWNTALDENPARSRGHPRALCRISDQTLREVASRHLREPEEQ